MRERERERLARFRRDGENGRGEEKKQRDEKRAPGSNPAPHYPIIYYASN